MTAKLSLEELRQSMSVFLHFPEVEQQIQKEAEMHFGKIALSRTQNGQRTKLEILAHYLDAGKDTRLRLRVLLGLCGGSMELLQRVWAYAFPKASLAQLHRNETMRNNIARFLLEPESLDVPSFVRQNFLIPNHWNDILRDENYLRTIIYRNVLKSKYSVLIGFALENAATELLRANRIAYKKGPVSLVENKEVDIAIPNIHAPKILIMSSYNLTTSSNQSTRAKEQARMREELNRHNVRNEANVQFINIIDGGGWLQRANDLKRIWQFSDYCFSHKTLPQLVPLVQSLME